jgi:hypothetical protein
MTDSSRSSIVSLCRQTIAAAHRSCAIPYCIFSSVRPQRPTASTCPCTSHTLGSRRQASLLQIFTKGEARTADEDHSSASVDDGRGCHLMRGHGSRPRLVAISGSRALMKLEPQAPNRYTGFLRVQLCLHTKCVRKGQVQRSPALLFAWPA